MTLIEEIALNLIPGDEVQIDGEMWRVVQHNLSTDNPHPVQMQLVNLEDHSKGKTVLTQLTHKYNRALRACGC